MTTLNPRILILLAQFIPSLCVAQLADTPWPKFQHDLRNSGCSEHVGPESPHAIAWSRFSELAYGPQVVLDSNEGPCVFWAFSGSLHLDARPDYFGRGDEDIESQSRLEQFRCDGSMSWNRRIAPWGNASPCLSADGRVYIGTGSSIAFFGRVYAFSTNGRRLWRSDLLDNVFYTHPTVGPGGVVFYPTEGGLFAFASNGSALWRYSGSYEFQCPSIGADAAIYLGLHGLFGGGGVVALNPEGTRRWYNDAGGTSGTTLAEDGTIYSHRVRNNYASDLIALYPEGALFWKHALEKVAVAHPAVGRDGTIYVVSTQESPEERGLLWAINPDGSRKWSVEFETGTDAPVVVDAAGNTYVVFYRSYEPLKTTLISFDSDGQERWRFDLGYAPALTGPAINDKGQLLIFAQKEGDPEPVTRILTLGDADDPTPPAIDHR
ncbi:MAG: PQQ-binding-like beta-propeller repeat protein [Phycisphaerales bacterium]|nr:PQQ-binding-like beta-propeller repeat protein [Phycisphaerales bacterium]